MNFTGCKTKTATLKMHFHLKYIIMKMKILTVSSRTLAQPLISRRSILPLSLAARITCWCIVRVVPRNTEFPPVTNNTGQLQATTIFCLEIKKKHSASSTESVCANKPTLYSSPSLKYQFVCKKKKNNYFLSCLFPRKKTQSCNTIIGDQMAYLRKASTNFLRFLALVWFFSFSL